MKKNHGLYILTVGIAIFLCYFLAAAIYGSGEGTLGYFLKKAWTMPVVAAGFAFGGVYVFIRGE